ncbi:D-aminoacyl-tRNA deacylase [Corynebacterium halotolerans]|uniref:D-aminoacyl-tRNA deacylase n=1 Tax=Corynebacterium halotolerans TaxID=225326 RepID=UPI003CF4A3C4
MKAVLTRVSSASVTVDGEVVGAIDCPETGGLLALVGVGRDDAPDAWETMVRKIAELRILDGERSVTDVGAPVLLVSQFTLHGRTAKGRRPSWSDAAPGAQAEPVIEQIAAALRERGISVEQGRFGAMMQVASVNDGPFTVLVDA